MGAAMAADGVRVDRSPRRSGSIGCQKSSDGVSSCALPVGALFQSSELMVAVRMSAWAMLMKSACGSVGGWSVIQVRSQGWTRDPASVSSRAAKGWWKRVWAWISSQVQTALVDLLAVGGGDADEEVEELRRGCLKGSRLAAEWGKEDGRELAQSGHLGGIKEAQFGSSRSRPRRRFAAGVWLD